MIGKIGRWLSFFGRMYVWISVLFACLVMGHLDFPRGSGRCVACGRSLR